MADGLLESLLDTPVIATDKVPAWLAAVRQSALAELARDGLPRAGNEAWKYTSLRALERRSFAQNDSGAASHKINLESFDLPALDGPRLAFVNGVFREDLSHSPEIDGLTVQALSGAIDDDVEWVRPYLTRPFDESAQAFARSNTALARDGALIRVAPGSRIVEPVHLLFFGSAAEADIAWQVRSIVELGDGASLRLIEQHVGDSDATPFGNSVSQYVLGPKSRLDLVQIQNTATGSTSIRRSEAVLAADANLSMHALEIGGQLARHDVAIELVGERSRFESRGVFALRGRQHNDTHLDIRHIGRDSSSDVLWRGVADQRARGVFHGAITIAAGADGSDARLSNKNLLLSANAEIDTQPVLEIHADEVKASHGATVGQLDETALFYLRSRGLDVESARQILTRAFCGAALDRVKPESLRDYLLRQLTDQLHLSTGVVA
ncbi:MAG: Fe-S cluster assembly protein SufD [Dokdonella sp.]